MEHVNWHNRLKLSTKSVTIRTWLWFYHNRIGDCGRPGTAEAHRHRPPVRESLALYPRCAAGGLVVGQWLWRWANCCHIGRTIVGGLDMIKTAIWIHLDPSLNLVRPSAHELDADARRRIGWMDAPRSPGLPPLVPQQAWVNGWPGPHYWW